MTFYLDHAEMKLLVENDGIRLFVDGRNSAIFPRQNIPEVESLLKGNYDIVKTHYYSQAINVIKSEDLCSICIDIVVSNLYVFNQWRSWYPREANRDLTFQEKEFDHPDTMDKVMLFLRKKYPKNYRSRCELILQMTPEKFKSYEEKRDAYFNK